VGGHLVWIHVWVAGDGATCYAIDPQRSADALERVIGIDWSGSMTHDGATTYDRFQDATHQKCVDHALRRARKLAEQQSGNARPFATQVIGLFTDALHTRDQLRDSPDHDQATQAFETYTTQLDELTKRPRANEDNECFAKHLYNKGGACQWFTFLLDPSVPATNHRAEQALKTPIVNRKVWGGNRTPAGARAQERTCSVLQTCKNRAVDAVHFISQALCGIVTSLFDLPSSPYATAK
jgi:transposase